MHIFQNGTPCQSEICFKMAHVSERQVTQAHTYTYSQCINHIYTDVLYRILLTLGKC